MDLTRRFGLFIGIIIFIIFFTDVILIYVNEGSLIDNYHYFTLLILSLVMIISSRYKIGKYIQVFSLICSAIVTFFIEESSGYGVGQIIIIVLISEKYGFFNKNMLIKLALSVVGFIGILFISLLIKEELLLNILAPILFIFVFGVSFIIIKNEEIKVYFKKEKELKDEIVKLKRHIKEHKEFIDPIQAGLSKTELIVLEALCMYKETNKDLAIRLSKSEHTIKSHIKIILIKVGVESRYQVIDLCQNYYNNCI